MLNKVELIGHLGRDIEVRTLENGTKVGTFSLATTESYKDKSDQWQKLTEWHNIVIWRPSESICKLTKGSLVHIEGKIKSRKYADKDAVERTAFDIVAERILRLDRNDGVKNESSNYPSQNVNDAAASTNIDNIDDDLPF